MQKYLPLTHFRIIIIQRLRKRLDTTLEHAKNLAP